MIFSNYYVTSRPKFDIIEFFVVILVVKSIDQLPFRSLGFCIHRLYFIPILEFIVFDFPAPNFTMYSKNVDFHFPTRTFKVKREVLIDLHFSISDLDILRCYFCNCAVNRSFGYKVFFAIPFLNSFIFTRLVTNLYQRSFSVH